MKMIRKATFADIEFMVEHSHDEFAKSIPLPISKTRSAEIAQALIFGHGNYFHVVEEKGEICGYLAAVKSTFQPWSEVSVAAEILFYVVPKHRKSRTAKLLLDDFLTWAKNSNCLLAVVTTRAALDGVTIGKFYEKYGFSKMDTNYFMRLQP